MWIYRVSCPLLPRGYIDADRVARDGGFAVERLDLGLREPERREQRGAKVELAGAIAVAVELGAVPGEWHQRLAGIAQPGEMHGMVCEIGVELRHPLAAEIGRASCRERVCQYVSMSVVAVSLKKT